MWSKVHTDNRKKYILVLVEGPTGELDDTSITAEGKYSVNITRSRNKIWLSLHYSANKKVLYANDMKIYQFKDKDSEIKSYFKRFYSQ